MPLRGSALWDLRSGRSGVSTDAPIASTPGILLGPGFTKSSPRDRWANATVG